MTVTSMPPATAATEAEEVPEKAGKKKIVMVLVGLVLLVAGSYKFVLTPEEPTAPEPGEVVRLEPIQVNLAGGHYLKVGISLQLTADAHEVAGGKALDAVIDLFSGRSIEEVTKAGERKKLKEELLAELEHDYHGDVMDVYLVDFVAQ